ncbi:MAG: DNA primase [Caldilineaceae bacterium SB0661_bin_32]|uniref:DNA primase n=1 Tax=Caldilineaceae bacterium SB0661_bin_32 TaxID=2605255 RepID=A0A6B1D9N5_9CHLR|nr:DNA primase [Caldilineaceae bacterium SB0661_bin_32]
MNVTEEIKARIDAVEFISRYLPLQRAGRSFKANCPFHQERTPSFVVFPDTGTWRCFGACGTGGDIFSFLMQKENLDFREALQVLAQETGVQLAEETDRGDARGRDLLYELNDRAALFFRNQLHRSQQAQPARDYLQRRGINAQVAAQFQLGFAPDSWDALHDHLVQAGYAPDVLHRADLVKHNLERDSFYDSFRNRLIVPIHDRQGRVIGFGGRVLDSSLPKYLNTAETPLFHKSHVVYGLDRAYRAIRQADSVVVVEGYMDVIAAHQFGFENVVACLGTALTEEQLRQLHRYTDNFILALDADTAGQQATLRGLNQARQALKRKAKPVLTATGRMHVEHRLSANLRITTLPEGRDPDDIIRQNTDSWQDLISTATPLVDYYFGIVANQYDLDSARGKGEAVAELTPLIAELGDEEEQQHYIQRLSRLVRIEERTIEQRVKASARELRNPPQEGRHRRRFTRPQSGQAPAGAEPQADSDYVPQEEASAPGWAESSQANGETPSSPRADLAAIVPETKLELFLLALLIDEPDLLIWLAEMSQELEIAPLRGRDFQQIEYREIFDALRRFIASDEPWDIKAFQETLNPSYHPVLSQLTTQILTMPEREPGDVRNELLKLLIRLRYARLRESLSAMQFLLHDAQENENREAVLEFSAIINANRRDRHHLEHVMARSIQVSYGTTRVESGIAIA